MAVVEYSNIYLFEEYAHVRRLILATWTVFGSITKLAPTDTLWGI